MLFSRSGPRGLFVWPYGNAAVRDPTAGSWQCGHASRLGVRGRSTRGPSREVFGDARQSSKQLNSSSRLKNKIVGNKTSGTARDWAGTALRSVTAGTTYPRILRLAQTVKVFWNSQLSKQVRPTSMCRATKRQPGKRTRPPDEKTPTRSGTR